MWLSIVKNVRQILQNALNLMEISFSFLQNPHVVVTDNTGWVGKAYLSKGMIIIRDSFIFDSLRNIENKDPIILIFCTLTHWDQEMHICIV